MTVFLFIFGGIFFFVGFLLTFMFALFGFMFAGFGSPLSFLFILFPAAFMLIGLGVLIYAFILLKRKKDISKKGTKYQAKIYGYAEDKSIVVNGEFTMNLKVRFFDRNHIEREAILTTNFPKNSNMYGIGMTVDIFEYKGTFSFDKDSLRYEHIAGEEELMDDKPINPEEQKFVAIQCPTCGASFNAVAGYSNKCPYCSGYINA